MTMTRVGFIGLGNMGSPMAAHLADTGFAMTVSDAAPGVTEGFVAEHPTSVAAAGGQSFAGVEALILMRGRLELFRITPRHVFTTAYSLWPFSVQGILAVIYSRLSIFIVEHFRHADLGLVGAADAMLTSLQVVARNPVPMAAWGLIVAVLLVIGSLPFFVGLAIVIPLLGHATWHLYRKVIEPVAVSHAPPPLVKVQRYAADFPSSLFQWRRKDS